jgi:hypothetical protein
MEPCGTSIFEHMALSSEDVELDLAGIEPLDLIARRPMVVTCKRVAPAMRRFPLKLRPIENNLALVGESGDPCLSSLALSREVSEGRPGSLILMLPATATAVRMPNPAPVRRNKTM